MNKKRLRIFCAPLNIRILWQHNFQPDPRNRSIGNRNIKRHNSIDCRRVVRVSDSAGRYWKRTVNYARNHRRGFAQP